MTEGEREKEGKTDGGGKKEERQKEKSGQVNLLS